MSVLEAVLLALVQGLTEFLPVSSSGHLAVAKALFGQAPKADGLFYEMLLHVATTLSIVVYFRREIAALFAAIRPGPAGAGARRVLALIGAASVPTAILGFTLEPLVGLVFSELPIIGGFFLVTTVLLLSSVVLRRPRGPAEADASPPGGSSSWIADLERLRWRDAVIVGVAQGLAVFPGVSRSGSTIATALFLGVPPLAAARFSMLVSLPAIGGGFLLQLRRLEAVPLDLGPQLLGSVIAFAVGLLAITWLLAAVRGSRLAWYAAYTALLGSICLIAG